MTEVTTIREKKVISSKYKHYKYYRTRIPDSVCKLLNINKNTILKWQIKKNKVEVSKQDEF